MVVGVLKEIGTEFHDETNHLIVHLSFFVHVDGKIGLVGSEVHLLSLFVVTFTFEFASFTHLNHSVLTLGEVSGDDLISLVPFVGAHVHFESLNEFASVDEEFLSLLKLSHFGVVTSDLLVVGSGNVGSLVLDQLDCSVPLSSGDGGLDCLVKDTSLNVVLNS